MLTRLRLPGSLLPPRQQPPTPLPPRTREALRAAYDRIAADLPASYPAAALAAAEAAANELGNDPFAAGRDGIAAARLDMRQVPFVTIDPAGATDLDQAMHLSRSDAGYCVQYAIADVGRFITPGDALDAETHERGQTIYLPDRRIPLHPEVLSEGTASLLPEVDRAAYVFTVELTAAGEIVSQQLSRAVVRSRAQLDYDSVQATYAEGGELPAALALLPAIGRALQAQETARGGIDLAIPDQEVSHNNGDFTLEYRPRQGIEDYNAQISLLAGRVAAALMLTAGQGVLRTLPAPDEQTEQKFLAIVAGLGFTPTGTPAQVLRSIDHQGGDPRALAVHYASPSLFRGADYTLITAGQQPAEQLQAAVAAPYAHATAPLRRLVDRYVLPIAEAASREATAPEWAVAGLADLPEIMRASGRVASSIDRQVIETTEAVVLAGREGEKFSGVAVGARTTKSGTELVEVHVVNPAVVVWAEGHAEVGEPVTISLREVRVDEGKVFFDVVKA